MSFSVGRQCLFWKALLLLEFLHFVPGLDPHVDPVLGITPITPGQLVHMDVLSRE